MRVKKLCHKLLSDTSIHQKRIEALSEVVETALLAKSVGVTKIGREMNNGCQTRSNIRKADRLYSNVHLHQELAVIYKVIAHQLIKTPHPLIVVDGSKLQNSSWYILRASVAHQGRALTLYEYPYSQTEQGSRKLYKRFLEGLAEILPSKCRPILLTDAEFRCPWFELLNAMEWDYVGRIRGDMNCAIGEDAFDSCQDIFQTASNKPRHLGKGYLSSRHDMDGYFYLHKRQPQGRHAHTRSGRHSDTLKSQRIAKSAREPWLLFSSLNYPPEYLIQAYELRMTIEENFRDTKSGRYGLGLNMTYSKQQRRYSIMLLIAALVQVIAYLVGVLGETKKLHWQFQANSIKKRRVLSRFFLGCELVKKQFSFSFRQINSSIKSLQLEAFLCFQL